MKLVFNRFIFIVVFLFYSTTIMSSEFRAEYKIELGKINIGSLFWFVEFKDDKYKITIQLKNKGLFSGLYNFSGDYLAQGTIINDLFVPNKFVQKWKTTKKKRDIEIYFVNGAVSKLKMLPLEKESPRTKLVGKKGVLDPLSSFVNIVGGSDLSKTLDGRRFYTMTTENNIINNNTIKKTILIKDYFNIWADHNRNDLRFIEFEQQLDSSDFVLPQEIKIGYKGLVFKLTNI